MLIVRQRGQRYRSEYAIVFRMRLYHYTSKEGYEALSSGSTWIPSMGRAYPISRGLKLGDVLTELAGLQAAASLLYYKRQFDTCDYTTTESTSFRDVHYGPGWYVTPLPPSTSSVRLLEALWQGNKTHRDKLSHWLELEVPSLRVRQPDSRRTEVLYLPLYGSRGGESNRPAGYGSAEPALLVTSGCREERYDSDATVRILKTFAPPLEVVPPLLAAIDGWSSIGADQQCNLLGYLGFDSGFPGIAFPAENGRLNYNWKQLLAVGQVIARQIGDTFRFVENSPIESRSDETFWFDFLCDLSIGKRSGPTLCHFRSQSAPVTREQIEQTLARASHESAQFLLIFATSTLAQNATALIESGATVFVLLTPTTRKQPQRFGLFDGEVLHYKIPDLWVPDRRFEGTVRFAPVESWNQIRDALTYSTR